MDDEVMEGEAIFRRQVTVTQENGLHLIPCSRIAEFARAFDGAVRIQREDMSVDAKSVLELMTLDAPQGTVLMLEATGNDAKSLLDGLAQLFERGFDSLE